ncbi:TPA: type II toxin-antitoxin system HicA family toxin [Serratia marcescens]
MTSDELIKLLKSSGWHHVRTKGSHHIFEKDGEDFPVVVPHPRRDLAIGTLHKILKQIGVKR